MRVLIVDDESLARRGVRARLATFGQIEIVGESADGPSAVRDILSLRPDLVFLDVQMPGMDGFDVIRTVPPEALPSVIFLTAFEHHALRAFDANAVDYLVKPPDAERFALAVRRALDARAVETRAAMAERLLRVAAANERQYLSRIAIRTGTRIELVNVDDVEWIASAGDYVELHGRDRPRLLRESMHALAGRLDPVEFVRIHRTRIVRRRAIVELRSIENREFIVRLSDGSQHRSSRTYSDALQRLVSGSRD